MTARHALRDATRPDHDAVDAAFGRFDLTTIEGYRGFLLAQATLVRPLEEALDRAGVADLVPDWAERRRADRLAADLHDIGASEPDGYSTVELSSVSAVLGAVYVLEGSRLGGKVLRRTIPADAPSRFLGGEEPDGLRWRELVERLDASLADPRHLEQAVTSARAVFQAFLAAASARQAA